MSEISVIQTLNSQSRNMQIDVQIITLDDNLNHPYFASIDISKDNLSPIGICKVVAPYDAQILQYWNTYIGVIIISFNVKDLQQQNTNSLLFLQSNELSERIVNDEYNYSFICRIQKIKHKGKEIIIYFEDLGWKFLQKVPKEFRETYIANQPLDKAFQAICELLEVDYAYSIEDLQEYNFGADGYSIEKDGTVIETVETILSKWQTEIEEENEEENNPLDDPQYENPSLIEFDNKNQNNDDYVRNEPNANNKIEEEDEDKQKNEELQKEFEKKIINMFIGNSFYESKITSNIMNYGNITVSPDNSASNNNEMSEVGSNDNSSSNNDSTSNNFTNNSSSNNSSSNNNKRNGWYNGQLYENGKISLSNEYVRTLSPQQALAKYKTGKNTYTKATLTRLLLRSGGSYLLS